MADKLSPRPKQIIRRAKKRHHTSLSEREEGWMCVCG